MISKRDHVMLFVYGTLKRGEENHFRMKDSKFVREAFTKDGVDLFFVGGDSPDIGKESKEGHDVVAGELFLVAPGVLKEIDEYEKPYNRKMITLDDGTKAYTYLCSKRVKKL